MMVTCKDWPVAIEIKQGMRDAYVGWGQLQLQGLCHRCLLARTERSRSPAQQRILTSRGTSPKEQKITERPIRSPWYLSDYCAWLLRKETRSWFTSSNRRGTHILIMRDGQLEVEVNMSKEKKFEENLADLKLIIQKLESGDVAWRSYYRIPKRNESKELQDTLIK